MKNIRILICDDEQEIASLIAKVLTKNNYEVAILTAMDSLMENVKKIDPDLILMDISMPDINGVDAAKMLYNDSDTAHIPVIFMSGDPKIEYHSQQLNKLYIKKPFDLDKLRSIIKLYALQRHEPSDSEHFNN